jgi:ribosomal protein S18 acetylase RimI-like enzyme
MPVTYRTMRDEDIPAVHDTMVAAFADLERRLGEEYEGAQPRLAQSTIRFRRTLATDPGGCWVAERDGRVLGAAVGILRDGVWGLSMFIVAPAAQGAGVGRELLARAVEYGAAARGRIILASRDPRAIAAYARLGLDLHPSVMAGGRPHGVEAPADVRDGGPADLPLTERIDRAVRGAAHGEDLLAMLAGGSRLLVLPERGYAVALGGQVRLLAATDEAAASAVLRAVFARAQQAGEKAMVEWISARQGWAVPTCLEAGLELSTSAGPLFTGGELGPFAPYLPNGAYL